MFSIAAHIILCVECSRDRRWRRNLIREDTFWSGATSRDSDRTSAAALAKFVREGAMIPGTDLLEALPVAVYTTDAKGRITSWNAGAMRIFGYDASEMIGESILRIIPPELYGEETEILARLQRANASITSRPCASP